MATGPKAGLYQNAQSASYLPPTLAMIHGIKYFEINSTVLVIGNDLTLFFT